MKIKLLRHATLIIHIADQVLLVDPMLSPAGTMDPVANASNDRRIPLGELPLDEASLSQALEELDAVLVTHNHRDHWDARARELLPQDLPILCQPMDEPALRQDGYAQATPIQTEFEWGRVHFTRTGGQHGSGEIGQLMGAVSGFVLRAPGEPSLYIAGDTIWCPQVAQALDEYRPDVVVVNAGAAQFLVGDPITMNAEDMVQVCLAAPWAQVIAVHMESVNHCELTRHSLREYLHQRDLAQRVFIPEDGEFLLF